MCLLLSVVLYQFLKGVGTVLPEESGPCDQITVFNLKHTQYSLKSFFVATEILFPEYEYVFILVYLSFENVPFLHMMALE